MFDFRSFEPSHLPFVSPYCLVSVSGYFLFYFDWLYVFGLSGQQGLQPAVGFTQRDLQGGNMEEHIPSNKFPSPDTAGGCVP